MYKKTGDSSHFLPRSGSFSTHPQRNGRVDVLPPDAKMHIYDAATQIADAEESVSTLQSERQALMKEVHFLRGVDRFRGRAGCKNKETNRINALHSRCAEIDDKIGQTRRKINEMKTFVSGGKRLSYAEIFLRLAEIELPNDVFELLSQRARKIESMVKGKC